MIACREGRLDEVQDLYRRGKGRPDDISEKNMTPLLYAAQGGKKEVVQFLLNHGANENWAGGSKQTTPLQWAIQHNNLDAVRALLHWGADPHHVSALGWNPLFYCWPRLQATWEDKSEILKLLAEHSVLNLEMVDSKQWTALHRASAFGTAVDVRAIHYAITAGNEQTYSELVSYYGDNAVRLVDKRGWTLLHIAASIGSRPLIRTLLEGGSDPNRLSRPFFSYMDRSLFGRKFTAESTAKAHSPQTHQDYLQVLSELSIILTGDAVVEELSDEEGDYWDAEE